MKKMFFSVTLLLSLCACSKESTTPDEFVSLDTIVCTREVTFNCETKAGISRSVELTFTSTYDVREDYVKSFSISCLDPDIDVNSLREAVLERFEEENGFALENTELNKVMDAVENETFSSENPFTACLMNCLDTREKGKGLGLCKFGCCVDAAVRFAKDVVTIIFGPKK